MPQQARKERAACASQSACLLLVRTLVSRQDALLQAQWQTHRMLQQDESVWKVIRHLPLVLDLVVDSLFLRCMSKNQSRSR